MRKGSRSSLMYTIIPMLGVTAVSFFALHHFMEHKYERWDQKSLGDPNKTTPTLEEEYEKMTKKIDLSKWEAKSVPGRDYKKEE
ncbi:hypothetical protein DFA_03572 [Cavenderia fasciculata]|uniref:Cytochrome c oxidase assembly protein COX16 homolog, mitochondrial n=1 Tax=Cavenderia fasciculata TaxID=261658 RepID=F4PI40_CACFS|nr:uncharacterized protein DFA_03572 [Cavenderia fasciculata]EGG25323.1 hypothetical protein DFA_03572 [Cavenderia fasciculata]|eukprot:XP_004363174.1 hypothetical protein DFA_03572 [Cavenderia fasciculata]